jgi:hypothetical protein
METLDLNCMLNTCIWVTGGLILSIVIVKLILSIVVIKQILNPWYKYRFEIGLRRLEFDHKQKREELYSGETFREALSKQDQKIEELKVQCKKSPSLLRSPVNCMNSLVPKQKK